MSDCSRSINCDIILPVSVIHNIYLHIHVHQILTVKCSNCNNKNCCDVDCTTVLVILPVMHNIYLFIYLFIYLLVELRSMMLYMLS